MIVYMEKKQQMMNERIAYRSVASAAQKVGKRNMHSCIQLENKKKINKTPIEREKRAQR